jgi:hydrogenase maturation factor
VTHLGGLAAHLASASLALARRMQAGATLWCTSGQWPEHAQHVAVEFVHPVIMGKRALPAEAVSDLDTVTTLRSVVEVGDVILVLATADDSTARSVVLRARAWGADTIWIGAGPRPPAGAADHVLWLDDGGAEAPYRGDLVLVYHLLWELTHVCLEHRGLLGAMPPTAAAREDEVCITCSDEGRIGEVQTLDDAGRAFLRLASGCEWVDISLVTPAVTGDLLVVHAGTAIGRVDAGRP